MQKSDDDETYNEIIAGLLTLLGLDVDDLPDTPAGECVDYLERLALERGIPNAAARVLAENARDSAATINVAGLTREERKDFLGCVARNDQFLAELDDR